MKYSVGLLCAALSYGQQLGEHTWHLSLIPPPRQEANRPFSATATSLTVQTLPDGSQVRRNAVAVQYRDAQGRVRTETGTGTIVIHDPTTGAVYRLNPAAKTVYKDKQTQYDHGTFHHSAGNVEDLGSATINGLTAHGSRTTVIVRAGAIGNTAEFHSTEEHWYSSDLNLILKSVSSDPRFGTTTYELANISRQPPAAALFQIPADYTVLTSESHDHTDRRHK